MKKFLISFIIGVVLMAIGTTSLVFELRDFEYIDSNFHESDTNERSEIMKLHDKENINIDFINVNSAYGIEYEYDDSMKDTIKITFANGVDYKLTDHGVEIYNIFYDDDHDNTWNAFNHFIDGLKQHKVYRMSNESHILITTSHDNRGKININTKYD